MTKPNIRKIYWSLLGIMLATTLFFSAEFEIPVLDKKANTYFTESISKAGLAYATCRIINASISIIQNSEIDLTPAGIGVSLAIGQVLDPIDDMTERLSDVLVTAIVSLGIQKLAYEISIKVAPPVLSILLFILSLLIWFKNKKIESFQKTIIKIIFIVMIARLCLPISSVANDFLYKHFFEIQISEAKEKLSLSTYELDELKTFSLPEIDGVLGTIKNSSSLLIEKASAFKNALMSVISNAGKIISSLVELTTLYVGIFFIQVLFLPLIIFFLLIKITNSLFNAEIPMILRHTHTKKQKKTISIDSKGLTNDHKTS
ncbi:MAG: hypothetical protein KAI40_06910 [Desulfobacterales bacterium]|nr:hypothetical protein [Desulfobacterales bacterium]